MGTILLPATVPPMLISALGFGNTGRLPASWSLVRKDLWTEVLDDQDRPRAYVFHRLEVGGDAPTRFVFWNY